MSNAAKKSPLTSANYDNLTGDIAGLQSPYCCSEAAVNAFPVHVENFVRQRLLGTHEYPALQQVHLESLDFYACQLVQLVTVSFILDRDRFSNGRAANARTTNSAPVPSQKLNSPSREYERLLVDAAI